MRNVLCLALLAPMMVLAAGTTLPVTALAPENGNMNVTTGPVAQGQPGIAPRALIGTIDTIGGTTYDWWTNGPRLTALVNSPTYGIHALWMYSAELNTTWSDRNMRYNFYDITTRTWNWLDPDYLLSGVSVFDKKAGYGNIDVDPASGIAIVGGHVTGTGGVVPRLARDAAPGAGIFEYADGEPVLGVCQWPPIAVGQDGQINIFPITAAYDLSYSHIAAGGWPTFSTPVTGIVPSPGFPTHNIAASKLSAKVSLVWEIDANVPSDAYQSHSTDGGITWDTPTNLVPPVAFGNGSDTLTSYHITSLFPWYDAQDRFHVVANLMPMVNDTGYIIPAQIWHYSPTNDPQWSRIHIATCDPANLQAGVGYNAMYACRPTIGQDDDGNLFVAWEQFDSANVEAVTSMIRADIFAARSTNNGATWGEAVKLTDAGTHSMRFPAVIDLALEGDPDTMFVLYEDDSMAGFWVQSEGADTRNAVILQKVVVTDLPVGVAEQPPVNPVRLEAAANPNPFGGRTRISYSLPKAGDVSLVVYDAVGRPVQTLASGRQQAGHYTATWDAGNSASGVYFYTLTSGKSTLTRKLILAD